LRALGEVCGRHRLEQLRRANAIVSKRRRRYLRARSAYQRVLAAPNRLKWPFVSFGPDRVWAVDIKYIPTRQGWLYLAAVLGAHTRRLIGGAMGDRPDQALASSALEMPLAQCKPKDGVIHHIDQGVQYTSKTYKQQLSDEG
jgi:putative transposase